MPKQTKSPAKSKIKPTESFSSLEAADGEAPQADEQKPRNIAEILSRSKKLRLRQTQEEFEASLELMSLAQLQDLSYEKRLMPSGNMAKMKAALIQEFIKERVFGDNTRKAVQPFADLQKNNPEKFARLQEIMGKKK